MTEPHTLAAHETRLRAGGVFNENPESLSGEGEAEPGVSER